MKTNLKKVSPERFKVLNYEELQSIKVLNYIATYDGIIPSEMDIIFILEQGIKKFISPKRQNLIKIDRDSYPIQIKKIAQKKIPI